MAKGVGPLLEGASVRRPRPQSGGELVRTGACIQTLNSRAKSLGSENLLWGSQSSRPQIRSLEPQRGGGLEAGLAASFSGGWQST